MGTFDIKPDAPGQLRAESLNITLKFERTSSTTGRVSWNIPTPAAGCGSTDQAYCGIIVTIDNTPVSSSKVPINGTVYTSDPTADNNIFAGDHIGTSRVIGAFYQDTNTTFFDVVGLTPNTPYYVSGFPTDCQFRYFREGVHAYSLDYTNRGTDGTTGSQIVLLNTTDTVSGMAPTDFTGLMTGIMYDFDIQLGVIPKPRTPVDFAYCNPAPLTYNISVLGTKASTYADLVSELNKQLALIDNTTQGPTAPNTGTFYWNDGTLYQWDGASNINQPVITQSTDPSDVLPGTYWVDSNLTLNTWNGTNWVGVDVLTSTSDPLRPIPSSSFWFNGTVGYNWNGASWCLASTIIQSSDPSKSEPNLSGAFWYNQADETFYKWDSTFGMWVVIDAIQSPENPTILSIGSHWFNESTNELNTWGFPVPGWTVQPNLYIGERAPTTPAPGKFWYNTTSQVLKQWDALLLVWNELNVISFPTDPAIRSSCDIWWNSSTSELFSWDVISNTWAQITIFFDQVNDPAVIPLISNGTLWYNPDTSQLYVWFNNCFNLVSFIDYPVDPVTQLLPGTAWYNSSTNTWKVLDLTKQWNVISVMSSQNDPTNLPTGTFWYNAGLNSLQMWNGMGWISILFTTTNPTPTEGTTWFNTTTNMLMIWNGVSWVKSPVKATVELDCHGNLLFTDTTIGSLSFVNITDKTLFKSLSVPIAFNATRPGQDGTSDLPSYDEFDIGTDGSNDARLTLMNEIRMELGYPVVDVELTPEQLDFAITKSLNEIRAKSGLGYKRGFFFMRVQPETQRYLLNNKTGGFNKIVDILGIQRLTSSFLSSAHGAGVYGQIVMQHLYNMGTFDLLSYHIMAEYTKTMEILFAARLTFTWNEQNRELWIHHRFPFSEPYVSVEATVERTEQDIMTDRYCRPWIRRWATANARLMLAEIRGKYSTLPGASGSITLNANDLRVAAKEEMETCLAEIDNYLADRPEEYGMATQFLFG